MPCDSPTVLQHRGVATVSAGCVQRAVLTLLSGSPKPLPRAHALRLSDSVTAPWRRNCECRLRPAGGFDVAFRFAEATSPCPCLATLRQCYSTVASQL